LNLLPAFSQVPLHFTNATFLVTSTSLPIISAIFAATIAPPTGQADAIASPLAIALARASQPAYPQPPQLLPGSASLIAISFSSVFTSKALPAKPRSNPIINPVPPTRQVAIIIPVHLKFLSILIQVSLCQNLLL